MNIFEAVKQSVTTWQAAESYGIRVNKRLNEKVTSTIHWHR